MAGSRVLGRGAAIAGLVGQNAGSAARSPLRSPRISPRWRPHAGGLPRVHGRAGLGMLL